jgi:hypothetical protein
MMAAMLFSQPPKIDFVKIAPKYPKTSRLVSKLNYAPPINGRQYRATDYRYKSIVKIFFRLQKKFYRKEIVTWI